MADIMSINDGNFQELVIQSPIPVILDFWAPWCTPCKMIAPMLDDLAKEYGNKIKIYKIDIDENPDTPTKFNVTSIPTLILFKDGSPMDKMIGAVSKNKIKGMIDSAW